MTQRYYEEVSIGDQMDALVVTVDERQLFFFSAATYNAHRIHYDARWARDCVFQPIVITDSRPS